MPSREPPPLTLDEIDDLLYFTRANEPQDLQQTISELVQKYSCTERDVLLAGVDPDSGNTIIHFCSANGFADLLKSLLSQIGIQSHTSNTANGTSSTVPLINYTNKEGNTALHWAAYNGHLEVVKALIVAGADMWIKNSAGHLAMFEAERSDKSDVVQYLLEAGGREVERTGTEKPLNVEDVNDVREGEQNAENGIPDQNQRLRWEVDE